MFAAISCRRRYYVSPPLTIISPIFSLPPLSCYHFSLVYAADIAIAVFTPCYATRFVMPAAFDAATTRHYVIFHYAAAVSRPR